MKLRERIILTLMAISVILVAPAVYGLFALRELEEIAQSLRARDAEAALTLARIQTSFGEVEHWERIYLALGGTSEEGTLARDQVNRGLADAGRALDRLAEGGYRHAVAGPAQDWRQLTQAILQEQALIAAGRVEEADAHRSRTVDPALAAMDAALDQVAGAIDRAGQDQVRQAQTVATGAATTTLLALAAALAIALVIAGWLTRSVLGPIQQLRYGMAHVAEGDFEPVVHVDRDRPDELGDLTRSFDRMTEQLSELDRIKAEFISIASHELKTPLSVIRGYVSLLQDGVYGEVPDQQQKVLGSLSDQTDRLARLIQQLLDISRFEAGGGRLELRPIQLREFLDDLTSSFEVLAIQNEIDFHFEMGDGTPPEVVGDSDRLNEVFGNLLSNAFKFTPRRGRIELRAESDGTGVAVEVADTGVGIPEDKLPRIFEKFYQVDNEAQPRSVGSGLGLAIAREIVEAHGGTIAAESTLGRGTTFRVVLPAAPVEQA